MALNPFQQALSDAAHRMGLRGQSEQQIYNTPEYWKIVQQMFGNVSAPAGITPEMIINQSPGSLEYRDPEGYIHQLIRNLNGLDPRLGSVSEASTNRPAVLPLDKTNPTIANILGTGGTTTPQATTNAAGGVGQPSLLQHLQTILANPVALSQIDPETMKLLQTMKMAEDQALQEQFQRESGTATAQLVGQGIGGSSIAGSIMGQLLQAHSLAQNNAQANQAQRQLGVQQFLTGANQEQNKSLQAFIQDLLSQGTQRDISSAGNETQRLGIGNQNEQFYRTLQEQIRQFDEQMRMQERQAMWNNIFKGVAAVTGVGTGLASGGLFKGGSAFSPGGSLGSYQTPPYIPNTSVRGVAS